METIGEKNRFYGITLFTPEDQIREREFYFETSGKRVPELGEIIIIGSSNECVFDNSVEGVSFIDGKLIEKKASKLADDGLYFFRVHVRGIRLQGRVMSCQVYDSKTGVVLQSSMLFGDDDLELDPEIRFFVYTDFWRKEGEKEEEKALFIPKDPALLSRLRFSFTSR